MLSYKKIGMAALMASSLIFGSISFAAEGETALWVQFESKQQNACKQDNSISVADIAMPTVTGVMSGLLYVAALGHQPGSLDFAMLTLAWCVAHSIKERFYLYNQKGVFSDKHKAIDMDSLDSLITLATFAAAL